MTCSPTDDDAWHPTSGSPDFTQKPTLGGDQVILRPAVGADAPALHTLMNDVEVAILTGSVSTSTPGPEELEDFSLQQLREIYDRWSDAEDRIVWTIREPSSEEIIDEALLMDLDLRNRSCGFRIWLGASRGRGLGTEATQLAVGHAFESQRLHRVSLEVYAFNPRARRAYENVGFRLEGTLREALAFDDGWVDAHVMSILAHEWPASQR